MREKQDAMSLEERAEAFRFFRLSKMYDQKQICITMCLAPSEMGQKQRGAIFSALKEGGFDRKAGRAPPSYMERELLAWVDAYAQG